MITTKQQPPTLSYWRPIGTKINMSTDTLSPHEDSRYLKLPNLWVRGHYFYCDGEALSFKQSTRKLDLIIAFLSAQGYKLSREQILRSVYGETRLHLRSDRYIECLSSSMLKIISDTRKILDKSFAHRFPGIDWLSFNAREKKWKMIKLKEDYVLMQLKVSIY